MVLFLIVLVGIPDRAVAAKESIDEKVTIALYSSWSANLHRDLIDMLKSEGYEIRLLGQSSNVASGAALKREELEAVDVLVVGALYRQISNDEIDSVLRYVKEGGNLIVLVPWLYYWKNSEKHWVGNSVDALLNRLNMDTFDSEDILKYNRKHLGGSYNVSVRGKITLKPSAITKGVENFYIHTGNAIDAKQGVIFAVGKDTVIDGGSRTKSVNFPVLLGTVYGKGKIIVALDFLVRPELSSFGMNGANYKLIVNTIEYLARGKSNPKPQGYYTKYAKGIEKKVKPWFNILFIPVDLQKSASIKTIAEDFQDRFKDQLGLQANCRIYPEIRSKKEGAGSKEDYPFQISKSPSAYRSDRELFEEVIAVVERKEPVKKYDFVVLITSDYGNTLCCGGVSAHGVHIVANRPEYPHGAIIFGKTVYLLQQNSQERVNRSGEMKVISEHNERDMTHILMHEFGHFLGFPDYMVSPLYIMSGLVPKSKLTYSKLFKDTISFVYLKRAEGLVYENWHQTAWRQYLSQQFADASRSYRGRRYRDCIIKSAEIMHFLTRAR